MKLRRLLLVFACVLAFAMCIPGEVFADTVIDTVKVGGFTKPVVGESAGDNIAPLSITDGADNPLTNSAWTWFDITGDKELEASDCFEVGKKYVLMGYLLTNDPNDTSVYFSDTCSILINGSDDLVDLDKSYVQGGSVFVTSENITCTGTKITDVSVDGFEDPIVGKMPKQLSGLTVPTGAHYDIVAKDGYYSRWYDNSEGGHIRMNPETVFTMPGEYNEECVLKAKMGYYFASDTTATINGSAADPGTGVDGDDATVFNVVKASTECTGTKITSISVTGFEDAVVGYRALELDKLAVPAGAEYSLVPAQGYNSRWYADNEEYYYVMEPAEVFVVPAKYSEGCLLQANAGYYFASDATVSIDYGTVGEETGIDTYDATRFMVIDELTACTGTPITSLNVNGFEQPKAGYTAGDLDNLSLESGVHYQLEKSDEHYSTWTTEGDELGESVLAAGEYFWSGQKYRENCQLIADKGYYFAENASAGINGDPANVDTEWSGIAPMDQSYYALSGKMNTCTEASVSDTNVYVVISGNANIINGLTEESYSVGLLHYGDAFYAVKKAGNYIGFVNDGKTVWVNRDNLALTFSVETAIKPLICYVGASSINVRSDIVIPATPPDNVIGGLTEGKEVLITGVRTDGNGDKWDVLEYPAEGGGVRLGYVMEKYMQDAGGNPFETESAELIVSETELDFVFESGSGITPPTPKKISIPKTADGGKVKLSDENIVTNDDGSYQVTVYPEDGTDLDKIGESDIRLPEGSPYVVKQVVHNDDGTLTVIMDMMGTEYHVTKGAGQTYVKKSKKTLEFTCNGMLSRFTGLKIDGTLIDASNYQTVSGSTVLTLKNEYLEKLAEGEHTLQFVYDNGWSDVVSFNVKANHAEKTDSSTKKTKSAKTGDGANSALYLLMLAAALGSIGTVGARRKVKR